MTILIRNSNVTNTTGNGAGEPGAAPNGSQMQGNPQASQFQPNGTYPPNAQCIRDVAGGSGATCVQQIAEGRIPLNVQPGNISNNGANNCVDGTRSLLSMLSTGQIVLGATSYGLGNALPVGAGVPAVGNSPAAPSVAGLNSVGGDVTTGGAAYIGN